MTSQQGNTDGEHDNIEGLFFLFEHFSYKVITGGVTSPGPSTIQMHCEYDTMASEKILTLSYSVLVYAWISRKEKKSLCECVGLIVLSQKRKVCVNV